MTKRWVLAFSNDEIGHWWREAYEGAGLDWVRTMVWVKLGCAPQFTGDRPASGHEIMTLGHPKGRKRWNGGGKRGVYTVPIELDRYGHGNVVREHTAQKPLELMLALVADFTSPDDVILDCYAGSGTTGVAALRLGRRVILVEREERWARLCEERLSAEVDGTSVSAARAGQIPMFAGGAK